MLVVHVGLALLVRVGLARDVACRTGQEKSCSDFDDVVSLLQNTLSTHERRSAKEGHARASPISSHRDRSEEPAPLDQDRSETTAQCEEYPGERHIENEKKARSYLTTIASASEMIADAVWNRPVKGCFSGEFVLDKSLPKPFHQGIAKDPTTWPYKTLMRFSQGPPEANGLPSQSKLSLAFKLFTVKDSESGTQDFSGEPINVRGDPEGWADKAGFPWKDFPSFASVLGFSPGMEKVIKGMNISGFVNAMAAKKGSALSQVGAGTEPDTPSFDEQESAVAAAGREHEDEEESEKDSDHETEDHGHYKIHVGGLLPISWGTGRGLRWWAKGPPVPKICKDVTECEKDESPQKALEKYLETNGNKMTVEMFGQLQGCDDEIEDAEKPWKSKDIAKLGELIIKKPEETDMCRKVDFDAWLTRPDHKPLGSVARALLKTGEDKKVMGKLHLEEKVPCTHSLANCKVKFFFHEHPDIINTMMR